LCYELAEELASAVGEEVAECDCIALSGGVDTSFLALAHPRKERLRAVTVDFGGPDAAYAKLVASKLGLGGHEVLRPSDGELLEAVDWVLSSFKTVDPIEVSADAVHYFVAKWALERGCACLISGDGGDELFLGYEFLEELGEDELGEWRRIVLEGFRAPSVEVGSLLGVKVVAPLCSERAKKIAKAAPLECLLKKKVGGKLFVRLYLESRGLAEVAWRRKAPVTSGSGSLGRLKSLASRALIGEGSLKKIEEELGFVPPSKLHAFLALRLLELGSEPPEKVLGGCSVCGRPLARGHCKFCGAYVLKKGAVSCYRGD